MLADRRRVVWAVIAAALLMAGVLLTVWVLRMPAPEASAPSSTPTAAAITPTATPTPEPTPSGFPADTASYDLAILPQVDVFALIPDLPLDADPFGAVTGEAVRPVAAGAPVFADPAGQPVAFLPRDYLYDGTTVPVVERQEHWIRVLLVGRQATPSEGSSAQVSGWLRAQDVELTPLDAVVEVNIAARTVDIVRGGVAERVADDFASGAPETPTPVGRSFIMTVRTEPSFGYTRGYPLVYLSAQSPTLDGFGGANAAITAFHYHDERSGQISNGCLRVDPAAIEALAGLALGTPVVIRP